jgi:hypothetical protein
MFHEIVRHIVKELSERSGHVCVGRRGLAMAVRSSHIGIIKILLSIQAPSVTTDTAVPSFHSNQSVATLNSKCKRG